MLESRRLSRTRGGQNRRPQVGRTWWRLNVVLGRSRYEQRVSLSSTVHNPDCSFCAALLGKTKPRNCSVIHVRLVLSNWRSCSHHSDNVHTSVLRMCFQERKKEWIMFMRCHIFGHSLNMSFWPKTITETHMNQRISDWKQKMIKIFFDQNCSGK